MATQWLSINDVRRLVKQQLYFLETGSKAGDQLIYDRNSNQYVGHVEGRQFHQSESYVPPSFITQTLRNFDNEWSKEGTGW